MTASHQPLVRDRIHPTMRLAMPRLVLALLMLLAGLGAVEVNLTASAASVTEGGSVVLTATRSSNVGALSVTVALTGTPPAGVSLSAAAFDFAAGSTTATVNLLTTNDVVANDVRQATAQITIGGAVTSTTSAVTVGIHDDDVTVRIEAIDVAASEAVAPLDGGELQLRVEGVVRTAPLFVQFEIHGTGRFESNDANDDYTLAYRIGAGAPQSITALSGIELINVEIPIDQDTVAISLTGRPDGLVEGAQTCEIRLPTSSLAYAITGIDRSAIIIADDDNRVVELSGSPAFESGPDGGITLRFLGNFIENRIVQVPYTMSGSVANNGTHYTALSGLATLAANTHEITIPIDAIADNTLDGHSITFTLLPSQDYILPGTPSVTVPLVDLAGSATIAAPASAIVESATTSSLDFPVTVTRLPAFAGTEVSIPFRLTGTTASVGEYSVGGTGVTWNGTSGVLVVPGVSDTGTIAITPVDDAVAEVDDTVRVVLESGQSVLVAGGADASGTILDDEPVVSLERTGAATATEGGAGVVFTVSYPGVPAGDARSQAVTVRFAITGTAAVGDRTVEGTGVALDGNGLGGTISIPANALSATILVTATADAVAEAVEPVILTLTTPTSGAAYRLGADVTDEVGLVDADNTPTVSISRVADAIEGRTVTCFRVARTGATTASLTVKLTPPSATADYAALPTTLLIPAGAASATLTVTAIAEGPDAGETIILPIAADAAYHVGTGQATVGIVEGFADNQLAIASEPEDLVMVTAAGWTSTSRLTLPLGMTAGRTRASLVAVTGGASPPGWLSVERTSADDDAGTAVFDLTGSPPVGTSAGRVLVRLQLAADIDNDGSYELLIPQDLLLWVLTSGGAG